MSYRVPRDISWWGADRSQCTDCKAVLGLFDLVPVFSWAATRGACRYCKAKVHYRYPLTEVVCGVLALMSYFSFGFSVDLLFVLLALPFLLALFLIDLEKMILPNQLVLILYVLGLVRAVVLFPYPEWAFLILYSFVYVGLAWGIATGAKFFLKKDALGFGDVKFFGVVGLWLGLPLLPYFMIGAGALAIFFAAFWSFRFGSKAFPFGPALILSFYCLLLFGGSFV